MKNAVWLTVLMVVMAGCRREYPHFEFAVGGNSYGAFIGRLSAALLVSPSTPVNSVAHKGRFYYIREKESGFKQLVVDKIITK